MHLQPINPKKFFALIIGYFWLAICFANPPDTVWRTDSRGPDIIFQQGFTSYGENQDFLVHIVGTSCERRRRNDGFISTTENLWYALDRANHDLNRPDVPTGTQRFVYEIRATNNFYDAETTLEHIAQTPHFLFARYLNLALDLVQEENEYVVLGNIPPQQIRMVTILTRETDGSISTTHLDNVNYQRADTHANPGPFTGNDNLPPEAIPLPMVTGSPPATACFLSQAELDQDPHFEPYLLNHFWIDDFISG